MGKRIIPQHEPLRVPKGWTEQARAFVIQLERIIDRIYAYVSGGFSKHDEEIATLDASQLTKPQSLTDAQKATVRANVDLNVANNLTTTAAGSVLDARQGKILGDRQIISVNANSASSLNAAIEMFHAAQQDMSNIYGRFAYNGVVYAVTGFKHSSSYGTYIVSSYANGTSNAWQAAKYNGTWSVEKLVFNSQLPKLMYYGHMSTSSVSDCVSNLISSMTKDGVYVFVFSWSGHPNGAVAQCARCQDTASTTKWNGIITAHDGNMYMFVKESSASTVTIRQISTTAI